MNKKILLIAFLLISTVFTSESDRVSSILLEVSQEGEFGKAITSLIQMKLKGAEDGKLQQINDLLQTLQFQITTTSQQEKQAHDLGALQCSAQIAQTQQQIYDLQASTREIRKEQDELTKEQGIKSQDLAFEDSNLATKKNDLTKALSDIQSESEQYSKRSTDYNESITLLELAIKLLQQLLHAGAANLRTSTFLEISQNFVHVKETLQAHVQESHLAFLDPIIQILTEMGNGSETSLDFSKVKQIIDLIQSLINQLRSDVENLRMNHEKTVKDLETLIADLQNTIEHSKIVIQTLSERLSEIDTRLKAIGKISSDEDFLLEAKQAYLKDTQDNCNDKDVAYSKAEAKRNTMLLVLTKLIDHFNKKVVTSVGNIE